MNRREFLPNSMIMKFNGLTPAPVKRGVSQRINLLFIIDQLCETGGAERCLLNMIRLLPKDRFHWSLVTFKIECS